MVATANRRKKKPPVRTVSPEDEAKKKEEIADGLMQTEKWTEAREALEVVEKFWSSHDLIATEALTRSRVEAKLGECWFRQGYFDEALDRFHKQLEYAEACEDPTLKEEATTTAHHNIGSMFLYLGDPEKARESLEIALTALEGDLDMPEQYTRTSSMMGHVLLALNDDGAIKRHQRDLKMSKRIGNDEGVCRAQLNLASTFLALGRDDDARAAFKDLLKSPIWQHRLRAAYLAGVLGDGDLASAADLCPAPPGLGPRPTDPVGVFEEEDEEPPTAVVDKVQDNDQTWPGTPDDAVIAALVRLELARRDLEARDSRGRATPWAATALWHLDASRLYLRHCAPDTSLFVALDFAIDNATGCAHAIRGDKKAASENFQRALARLQETEEDYFGPPPPPPPAPVVDDPPTKKKMTKKKKKKTEKQQPQDETEEEKPSRVKRREPPSEITLSREAVDYRYAARLKRVATANDVAATQGFMGFDTMFQDKEYTLLEVSCDAIDAAINALPPDESSESTTLALLYNHRGCCKELLGLTKEAVADFEAQYRQVSDATESQCRAVRNLADLYQSHGDMLAAINYAKQHLTLAEKAQDPFSIADAARRLVVLYSSVSDLAAEDPDDDDDDNVVPPETVTWETLETMHPRELEKRECDLKWIKHNREALAHRYLRVYYQYEDAINPCYYDAPELPPEEGPAVDE